MKECTSDYWLYEGMHLRLYEGMHLRMLRRPTYYWLSEGMRLRLLAL
jgi:hypothetical protein